MQVKLIAAFNSCQGYRNKSYAKPTPGSAQAHEEVSIFFLIIFAFKNLRKLP